MTPQATSIAWSMTWVARRNLRIGTKKAVGGDQRLLSGLFQDENQARVPSSFFSVFSLSHLSLPQSSANAGRAMNDAQSTVSNSFIIDVYWLVRCLEGSYADF